MQRDLSSRHGALISLLTAGFALCVAAACSSADEADEVPDFTPFNPSGAGGAGQPAPLPGSSGQTGQAPGAAAGGSTSGIPAAGNTPEGNGGTLPLGAGGTSSAGVGTSNGGAPAQSGTGGSVSGTGGSAVAGNAGAGSVAGPGPGRVGAELCPPGPFGAPLPGNLAVTPLASVGDNGFFIFEGAVWTGDALYLSEIGNGNVSQIDRFTPGGTFERGVFPNTGSNGLALDGDGNLVLAAHDVGGISRVTLPGGAITRGAQTRNGLRFNSPNDLVVRGDGNVYFTDPDFQSPGGRIQGGTFVYRIAPPLGAGEVSVVDDDMDNPNGITLSPDGNTLYASANGFLREYSLDAAGAATVVGDLVTGFGQPDGMAMDCAGNIYAVQNGAQTITVFSPDGDNLGVIGPNGFEGQGVTNAAFGGPNRTTLFITTFSQGETGGLYSVELNVPGLPY